MAAPQVRFDHKEVAALLVSAEVEEAVRKAAEEIAKRAQGSQAPYAHSSYTVDVDSKGGAKRDRVEATVSEVSADGGPPTEGSQVRNAINHTLEKAVLAQRGA